MMLQKTRRDQAPKLFHPAAACRSGGQGKRSGNSCWRGAAQRCGVHVLGTRHASRALFSLGLAALLLAPWSVGIADLDFVEWRGAGNDGKWEQNDANSFISHNGILPAVGETFTGDTSNDSQALPGDPPPYYEGSTDGPDHALFLGLSAGVVDIDTPGNGNYLAPASTLVDASVNYTFQGQRIEGYGPSTPSDPAYSLTKAGSGTLTFQQGEQNAYDGGTTIYGGTVVLDRQSGTQTLRNDGAVTVTGGTPSYLITPFATAERAAGFTSTTLSGTLDVNGNDEIVGLVTLDNNGQIVDNAGGGSLSGNGVGYTGAAVAGLAFDLRDGVVSAVLAGPGSLTKNTGTNLGNDTGILAPDNTVILSALNTYTGTTTIADGTLEVGVNDSGAAGALGNNGTITFTGGELQYGSGVTQDYSSRIQSSSSAITVDTNSNNVTYASALAGTNIAGLTKLGTGTLTLTATSNGYSGTTTVSEGTLALSDATTNNNIQFSNLIEVQSGAVLDVSGLNSGTMIVVNGQTLRGDGSVTGSLNPFSGSSVTVGDGASGIGDLDVSGNFYLNAGADLNIQISDAFTGANPTAGTHYDQLSVTGSVGLEGALNVTEFDTLPAGNFNPDFAEVFTIVDNLGGTSLTGTFSNFNAGDSVTIDSHVLKLYYNADGDSGNANDVVLVNQSGPVNADGLFVDDQFTSNVQVDGNQERALSQTAFVGINAFATTDAAFDSLSAVDYPPGSEYDGILTLNGNGVSAYDVDLDHNARTGDVTLNLVADLDEGVDDVTISNLQGSAGDSVVLRSETGSSRGNLIVQQGTFAGVISETGAGGTLTKTTAGTLTLTGTSTYSGATTISAGTLQLGDGGITGALNAGSSITIASGASLAINQSDTVTQGSEFSSTPDHW